MNFEQARNNMVDSQIHTMGVVSEPILNVLRTLPREKFVPADKQALAYCDEDLAIGNGRYLMEPQVLARLVQASDPKSSDNVLVVGAGTGYAACVFASLAQNVVALDHDGMMLEGAAATWNALGLGNITAQAGTVAQGAYDLVFINGTVCEVPQAFKENMVIGGRMVAIVRANPKAAGKAAMILRTAPDQWSERVLFDANTPYLTGMEPRTVFAF